MVFTHGTFKYSPCEDICLLLYPSHSSSQEEKGAEEMGQQTINTQGENKSVVRPPLRIYRPKNRLSQSKRQKGKTNQEKRPKKRKNSFWDPPPRFCLGFWAAFVRC